MRHRPIADHFHEPEPPRLPCVCGSRLTPDFDGLCYCGRKPSEHERIAASLDDEDGDSIEAEREAMERFIAKAQKDHGDKILKV